MKNAKWASVLMALVATSLLLSGCGQGDSGASSKPAVKIKPSEPAEEGEAAKSEEKTAESSDAPAAEGIGSVKGTISFTGDAPKLPPLVKAGDATAKDSAVCAAHDVPNQELVVGESGGIANVFVFLDRAPKGAEIPEASKEPVIFDQKGCMFIPHAMIVRAGQTVKVVSEDAVAHNTHTFPVRNVGFNTVVAANDRKGVDLVYDKAEKLPVQVKCDIHPWMLAWHLPLDHPFMAVTDANGNFEIKGLPAGKHKFRVWQEKAGLLERGYEVEIKADSTAEVKLSYAADKFTAYNGPAPKSVIVSSH